MDIQAMRAERDRLNEQIHATAREQRRAKFELARAAEEAAREAHYARMFDEIGKPLAGLNSEQHFIVYAMAYEQGHASGYDEVARHYDEFAELARKLIQAN